MSKNDEVQKKRWSFGNRGKGNLGKVTQRFFFFRTSAPTAYEKRVVKVRPRARDIESRAVASYKEGRVVSEGSFFFCRGFHDEASSRTSR